MTRTHEHRSKVWSAMYCTDHWNDVERVRYLNHGTRPSVTKLVSERINAKRGRFDRTSDVY